MTGGNNMIIKNGDKVKVDYTGSLEDGKIFDDSKKHGKPLEFEVGAKQVIKGFEDAVMGMKKDEEKNISLKPEEAYGDYNKELIKKVPRDGLPKDQEPKPGMMLMMSLTNGQQVPAKIKEVSENDITIDLNHPLAGKVLNFKLKIAEINS